MLNQAYIEKVLSTSVCHFHRMLIELFICLKPIFGSISILYGLQRKWKFYKHE